MRRDSYVLDKEINPAEPLHPRCRRWGRAGTLFSYRPTIGGVMQYRWPSGQ
jgi:hypothetical protein